MTDDAVADVLASIEAHRKAPLATVGEPVGPRWREFQTEWISGSTTTTTGPS